MADKGGFRDVDEAQRAREAWATRPSQMPGKEEEYKKGAQIKGVRSTSLLSVNVVLMRILPLVDPETSDAAGEEERTAVFAHRRSSRQSSRIGREDRTGSLEPQKCWQQVWILSECFSATCNLNSSLARIFFSLKRARAVQEVFYKSVRREKY